MVYKSLPFRLMAHTAEDLCEFCMPPEELDRCGHGDVKHGFVITFPDDHEPAFDILLHHDPLAPVEGLGDGVRQDAHLGKAVFEPDVHMVGVGGETQIRRIFP